MDFASRRQQKLLADRGLVIMPQGPGMVRFLVSAALLLGVLVLMKLCAEPLVAERVKQLTLKDFYHMERVRVTAGDHWEVLPDDLRTTEKFARWRPHNTDGVTEPLWPWLASRVPGVVLLPGEIFHHEGAVEPVLWAQVGLAVGFAGLIGLLAAKRWPVGLALGAVLPAAWLVLVPLALDLGPGLLFAVLNFTAWMCAVRLLRRNGVALHVVFGIVCGLAWLTDARGWIVPAVWLVVSAFPWLRGMLRRGEVLEEAWSGRRHFIGLVGFSLAWLLVCAPRLSTASARWEQPFFSAWQQLMWAENAQEAFRSGEQIPRTNPQERTPVREGLSFATWRANPNAKPPLDRLKEGVAASGGEFVRGNPWVWRGIYPAGLLAALAVAGGLLLWQRKRPDQEAADLALQSGGGVVVSAFVVLSVLAFVAWEAWLWPVTGSRGGWSIVWFPLVYFLTAAVAALTGRAEAKGVPAGRLVPVTVLVWGLNVGLVVLPVVDWLRHSTERRAIPLNEKGSRDRLPFAYKD